MYPFWNTVVEPVLTAAGAERVVEIGALRGDTTVRLLDLLGPQSELHVIDPLPSFDPEEHSRRFPGRYVFHRDISHNVLPGLPAVDAALVDGDHNWFTVYHELRFLREAAEAAGRPLPLLVMHDVCWPYGRRDLYYEPEPHPGRVPPAVRAARAAAGPARLERHGRHEPPPGQRHRGGRATQRGEDGTGRFRRGVRRLVACRAAAPLLRPRDCRARGAAGRTSATR